MYSPYFSQRRYLNSNIYIYFFMIGHHNENTAKCKATQEQCYCNKQSITRKKLFSMTVHEYFNAPSDMQSLLSTASPWPKSYHGKLSSQLEVINQRHAWLLHIGKHSPKAPSPHFLSKHTFKATCKCFMSCLFNP